MADVVYDSRTFATNSSVATLAVDKPTNAASGDLLIIMAGRNAPSGADSIVDNNGSTAFTKNWELHNATSGWTMCLFSRRIGGSEPSTYTFDFSGDLGATTFSLVNILFKNPHPSTIFEVSPSGSTEWSEGTDSDGNVSYTNISSAVDKCIHIICSGIEGGGGVTGYPGGYTSIISQGATHMGLTAAYKVITPAGATGSLTGTQSVGGSPTTQSFLIKNDPTVVDPNAYTVTRKIVYATR